jgi:hypothetical protein
MAPASRIDRGRRILGRAVGVCSREDHRDGPERCGGSGISGCTGSASRDFEGSSAWEPRHGAGAWGDRDGGAVAAIERTTFDDSSAWAATTTGRVFISKNVDADPASAVTWTRLDDDTTIDPPRFVSSIYVDPANGNHAWISYSGYGVNTPGSPEHVVEVTYDSGAGTSTWIDRSNDLGDLPVTDLVRDDNTGDLYASSDFGVMRLASGTTSWTLAAPGMPAVEIAGLTIVPSDRVLYAASHGLSAWKLDLAP